LWQHLEAMYQVMQCCIKIEDHGFQIKPLHDYLQEVIDYSDADYAKDIETRQRVSGYSVFLNGLLVQWRIILQECVTEAESIAAT
jgi:hypothetical protein